MANQRLQFGIKKLLLIPVVALLLLAWVNFQFKNETSTTVFAFGITLNGLQGREELHFEFEKWLEEKGYQPCEPPIFGNVQIGGRDDWFVGNSNGLKHFIVIQSNSKAIQTNVYYESTEWVFQKADSNRKDVDDIVAELDTWWTQNRSLLKPAAPN